MEGRTTCTYTDEQRVQPSGEMFRDVHYHEIGPIINIPIDTDTDTLLYISYIWHAETASSESQE